MTAELPEKEMLEALEQKTFASFSASMLSEAYLKRLADHAAATGRFKETVGSLMAALTSDGRTREFDWNCGSFVQHADPEVVFDCIPGQDPGRTALYESIGLTWCLGEFGRRDQLVIDFLEDVVAKARSPESWWRAAYALEKLGLVDAVSYLKSALRAQGLPSLDECLSDLGNERHRIGILLHSTVHTLQETILPTAKQVLCGSDPHRPLELIGAAWIIGRFRYLEPEVEKALRHLLHSENYEVRFYGLQAIREIGSAHFLEDLRRLLDDDGPLLRKMTAQGLGRIDRPEALEALRLRLRRESSPEVLSALTQAIYDLTHYAHRETVFVRHAIGANENGMITDEADKWYLNPDIYHTFSEHQDPEDLCLQLALQGVDYTEVKDPVDLGSGTGRFAWYILENVQYTGALHCVDSSEQMRQFLDSRRRRESVPSHRIKIHGGTIADLPTLVGEESSDLIVAAFSFPSKLFDRSNCLTELAAVYRTLRPDGYFVTVGWDETFNDELNEMWYRYVPDTITARNFEDWRVKRVEKVQSARNCGLTWFKRGLRVPLEFVSVETSARVMGYLFGRSAADEILRTKRTRWMMSMGITIDRKDRLRALVEAQ